MKILDWFKNLSYKISNVIPRMWQFVFFIGIICAVTFGIATGLAVIGLLTILIVLFVWLRQLWWFITKTGDYENKNKKR